MIKGENKMNAQRNQYLTMYLGAAVLIAAGFLMGPPIESIKQLWILIKSQPILLTDYFAISSIGTALINSGLMMILVISIARISKCEVNGIFIASTYIVGGFSLFGKNLYNVISIILGVYLYSLIKKEKFSKHAALANFGTSLAPLVSQVTFGMNLPPVLALILANVCGLTIGFVLPPLAGNCASFHKGFSIYNGGFTTGFIGLVFMSLFRLLGYNHTSVSVLTDKTDIRLMVFLFAYFFLLIVTGYLYSRKSLKEYVRILSYSGKPGTDFVVLEGFGSAMVNMGVMGISAVAFALLCKAPLNGPVVGAIFTVVGFSALANNLTNSVPVVIGIVLATLVGKGSMATTGAMITALFATTLAPVAGHYGIIPGIMAGFLHVVLVSNLAYLHGWMNLYNNGFAGGFVAGIMVPLLEAFRKKK